MDDDFLEVGTGIFLEFFQGKVFHEVFFPKITHGVPFSVLTSE